MSDTQTTLDQIFDAEPVPTPEPQATAAQEPALTGAKQEAPEPPAGAAAAEHDPYANAQSVPRRALEDERKKRQELQRKLDEMERTALSARQQQPASQQQQHHQQAEDPVAQFIANMPDPLEDPQGFKAATVYLQQWQINQLRQQMAHESYTDRVLESQEAMREAHEDYDEMEVLFVEAAKEDPSLAQKIVKARNPAKFAYEQGRRYKLAKDMGNDPDAYIQAQVQARLAELGVVHPGPSPQQTQKLQPQRSPVPKSLAKVQSATPRDDRGRFASNGPTPLEAILDG